MTVYVIATLNIHDQEAYDRYQNAFMPVFNRYGGRLLAADHKPRVMEGESDRNKVVLMEFPDRESYEAFALSEDYQEIAKDRHAGADTVTFLVRAIPQR